MIALPKTNQIDSIVLANYILKHYGPMSHLKLQKLLFYCDAYCLAYFGQELISDKFEAWVHGPVCRKVYNEMKGASVLYTDMAYSSINGIDEDITFDQLAIDVKDLINDILTNLTTWSGIELERATHRERPWIEARHGYSEAEKCYVEISKITTRDYYRMQQGL
ncbi:MAG: DUF4065 domain-containing protein [Muribaculaceae bacterium]|nr:DUF4065 domain-containing protein [Muribaculaceae bacterium]